MTRWVADDRIGWRILLTAEAVTPPAPEALGAALTDLYAAQAWSSAAPPLLLGDDHAGLRRRLVDADPHPLLVASTGSHVVISAHHSAVDGLGLLEVLERLGLGPARSTARGLGDVAAASGLAAGIGARLSEALLHPPLLPVTAAAAAAPGDTLVAATVAGSFRSADLVHAAALAIGDRQRARGARSTGVAVAVGAARVVRRPGEALADDSALLRLRDVDRLDRVGVAAALRAASPQPSPHAAGGSALAGAALGLGLRLLAPRLGSTLLVSHLGEVTAPAVRRLELHPVTAGGSGLSLGAVGHGGGTSVTLRGRSTAWDDDGLEQLLEAIIHRL
ncbi:MAG: hypothetical protein FWE71_10745 [Nocardioidaceae bacterium]|nr:hypothetical protein [Nocardioidaceae bacterium]MCL2613694.1 hypothetical protein [Nocardioidaceae bacterium]